VVLNDALRTSQGAHTAGEKISDTQVQPRVVTLAKTTAARQWLGGAAPVALVAACRDARRACRDWFDSLAGAGKGRKVGHPRFRSRKDNRASIRLTRNALAAAAGGVRVAKVGDVRLAYSLALPSVPSGVTLIREAGGRHCASFVVAVAAAPLPARTSDVGLDPGLARPAVLSAGEVIESTGRLRRRARALARAQRALARKTKGSKRGAKAAGRVAVQHRKAARLDAPQAGPPHGGR
jgi:putative transposase